MTIVDKYLKSLINKKYKNLNELLFDLQKIKNQKLKIRDDFKFCYTCNCYHYPGCHNCQNNKKI